MTDLEKANKIISENLYMTLATATPKGEPWITPVTMAYDQHYNFCWTSYTDTKHSQLLEINDKVAATIFDSTASHGQGGAVYIVGKVQIVLDTESLKKAVFLVYGRKQKPPKDIELFMGDSTRRFYKLTPEQVWLNADGVNQRVEVGLS